MSFNWAIGRGGASLLLFSYPLHPFDDALGRKCYKLAARGVVKRIRRAQPRGTRRTPKFNGNAPHAARRVVRVEPRGSAARAWQSPSLSLALFFSVFHFFYFFVV